jgi:hypothetical protein
VHHDGYEPTHHDHEDTDFALVLVIATCLGFSSFIFMLSKYCWNMRKNRLARLRLTTDGAIATSTAGAAAAATRESFCRPRCCLRRNTSDEDSKNKLRSSDVDLDDATLILVPPPPPTPPTPPSRCSARCASLCAVGVALCEVCFYYFNEVGPTVLQIILVVAHACMVAGVHELLDLVSALIVFIVTALYCLSTVRLFLFFPPRVGAGVGTGTGVRAGAGAGVAGAGAGVQAGAGTELGDTSGSPSKTGGGSRTGGGGGGGGGASGGGSKGHRKSTSSPDLRALCRKSDVMAGTGGKMVERQTSHERQTNKLTCTLTSSSERESRSPDADDGTDDNHANGHFNLPPPLFDLEDGLQRMADRWPGVSLFKPCCGSDATHLEQNLESGVKIAYSYPKLEIIFCIGGAEDPAKFVIQKVLARHPTVDARMMVGMEVGWGNPKMANIARAVEAAKYDHFWFQDANIQTSDCDLRALVEYVLFWKRWTRARARGCV